MKLDKAIASAAFSFAVVFLSGSALSEEVGVSARLTFRADATVSTKTTAVAAVPELPAPLFHFDVRRTNDWVWANAAKTRVVKIPSLAGARYLKGGDGVSGANGIDGGNWAGADTVHRAPAFSFDESLGEHVLDFGKFGDNSTYYGMLFDPVDDHTAGDAVFPAHRHDNIGVSLTGLDKRLVHGLDRVEVLGHDVVDLTASDLHIPAGSAEDALVGSVIGSGQIKGEGAVLRACVPCAKLLTGVLVSAS